MSFPHSPGTALVPNLRASLAAATRARRSMNGNAASAAPGHLPRRAVRLSPRRLPRGAGVVLCCYAAARALERGQHGGADRGKRARSSASTCREVNMERYRVTKVIEFANARVIDD